MCINPYYKLYNKINKKLDWRLQFNKERAELFNVMSDINVQEVIRLKCGKCLECVAQYSNEWALRIMMEAKNHEENCFITLTYAENPGNLVKKDLRAFIKALRQELYPQKIRYFCCGEYGAKGGRPHYHIIIFGWIPKDLVKLDNEQFLSPIVFKLWRQRGFVSVTELNYNTARYCAKYMQKFNDLKANDLTGEVVQSYVSMSLKPGIGYNEINLKMYETDKIYYRGRTYPIPRYFDKKVKQMQEAEP